VEYGGLVRAVEVFVSVCSAGMSALECDFLCVQMGTASGPLYDSGCPNLWKQWLVSNQSEPWGFKPANYNV